jgi:hypothetical protein
MFFISQKFFSCSRDLFHASNQLHLFKEILDMVNFSPLIVKIEGVQQNGRNHYPLEMITTTPSRFMQKHSFLLQWTRDPSKRNEIFYTQASWKVARRKERSVSRTHERRGNTATFHLSCVYTQKSKEDAHSPEEYEKSSTDQVVSKKAESPLPLTAQGKEDSTAPSVPSRTKKRRKVDECSESGADFGLKTKTWANEDGKKLEKGISRTVLKFILAVILSSEPRRSCVLDTYCSLCLTTFDLSCA